MNAIMTFKGLTRGETGDTLKFTDDASQSMPPAEGVKSVRWEPSVGRLIIESGKKEIVEIQGELRRTDAWELDTETGEIEARATVTFACEGRLHGHELAALVDAEDSLRLTFKPAQGQLPFGEAAPRAKQEV